MPPYSFQRNRNLDCALTLPILKESGHRVRWVWELLVGDEPLVVISNCLAQPMVMLIAWDGILVERSKCPLGYRVRMTRKRAIYRMKQKRAATQQHRQENAESGSSELHSMVWQLTQS